MVLPSVSSAVDQLVMTTFHFNEFIFLISVAFMTKVIVLLNVIYLSLYYLVKLLS